MSSASTSTNSSSFKILCSAILLRHSLVIGTALGVLCFNQCESEALNSKDVKKTYSTSGLLALGLRSNVQIDFILCSRGHVACAISEKHILLRLTHVEVLRFEVSIQHDRDTKQPSVCMCLSVSYVAQVKRDSTNEGYFFLFL
jgi:hypothetical protein